MDTQTYSAPQIVVPTFPQPTKDDDDPQEVIIVSSSQSVQEKVVPETMWLVRRKVRNSNYNDSIQHDDTCCACCLCAWATGIAVIIFWALYFTVPYVLTMTGTVLSMELESSACIPYGKVAHSGNLVKVNYMFIYNDLNISSSAEDCLHDAATNYEYYQTITHPIGSPITVYVVNGNQNKNALLIADLRYNTLYGFGITAAITFCLSVICGSCCLYCGYYECVKVNKPMKR